MSDNADIPELEVHPAPADATQNPPAESTAEGSEQAPIPEDVNNDDLGDADLAADLNLAAALSSLPPAEDDEQHAHEQGAEQGHEEGHQLDGEHDLQASQSQFGEGLDPDMLVNLAALSRIEHDDDEEQRVDGGEDELVVDEGQDFADLIGQAELTHEQVQEIVDNFSRVEEEPQDEVVSSAAPTPRPEPIPQPHMVRPERPMRSGSDDDIHEVSGSERRDHNNIYYTENGKLKRRRNRTVL